MANEPTGAQQESASDEFQRKKAESLCAKIRKLLTEKNDAQKARVLELSYEEAMTGFEAGAIPPGMAFSVLQDFLVKLTTC